MSDVSSSIEIPKRSLFKSVEVCELLNVQPYVLRTWEAEFPELGVAKTPGGPRAYRRADVEQVVRIRHLLLVEGLTLAGVRRRLVGESMPVAPDAAVLDKLIGENARERLTEIKRGLRSLMELLSRAHAASELRLTTPTRPAVPRPAAPVTRATAVRGKGARPRRTNGSRRKRA
jgi:DNA-binding transcriptional MerR regulator